MIAASVILTIGVIGVAGLMFLRPLGPDLKQYEALREPRISTIAPQNMLVVRATGDPAVIGPTAFKTLFNAYFKLKNITPGMTLSAPRVRWSQAGDTPRSAWQGMYALPIPATAQTPPQVNVPAGLALSIEMWEYGMVAEVLHVGPYSDEGPIVDKLHHFIETNGYRICGAHEEEYLKGPGMLFKGNPKSYYTIIRYQVEPLQR